MDLRSRSVFGGEGGGEPLKDREMLRIVHRLLAGASGRT